MNTLRIIWLTIGLCALGLGALGVLLPLLPTTPFILLAAFAFAKSSARLHDWITSHSVFGPIIADWRRNGAISRPAKIAGAVSMAAVFALSVAFRAPAIILIVQAIVLSLCAAFVLSRPSPPES